MTAAIEKYVQGTVVRGFGRGGKELGFPTANLESPEVKAFIENQSTGIYAGYARVEGFDGAIYEAAISLGWNPTFADLTKKVLEVHLLTWPQSTDFYGKKVDVLIVSKIREELKFDSLEALMVAIQNDCELTSKINEELLPRSKAQAFFDSF